MDSTNDRAETKRDSRVLNLKRMFDEFIIQFWREVTNKGHSNAYDRESLQIWEGT